MTKEIMNTTIKCYVEYLDDLSDEGITQVAAGAFNVWLLDLNRETGKASFDLIVENFKEDHAMREFYNNFELDLMCIVAGPGVNLELNVEEDEALQGDIDTMDLDELLSRRFNLMEYGKTEEGLTTRIAAAYRPALIAEAAEDIDKAVAEWSDRLDAREPVEA